MTSRKLYLQFWAVFMLVCAGLTPAAAAESGLPPVKLETLISCAVENNPEIRAVAKKTEALGHTVPQAGSLDDPRVGIGLLNAPIGTLALDQTPMTGFQRLAKQKVPYPGKLRLRKEIASTRVNASQAEYRQVVDGVMAKVKAAYAQYYFVDQATIVTQENKKVLEELVEITDIRYSTGQGVQQDSLKARVEVAKLLDELIKLRRAEETVKARINTLMDRSPRAPLGRPDGLEQHPLTCTVAQLEEIAVKNNPLFSERRWNIARFGAAMDLAEKDLMPDFEFGVGYRLRSRSPGDPTDGKDFWSFSAMINIPIYAKTKQREKIGEEQANIEFAQTRLNATKNDVFFQIKDLAARIEEADKQIVLFKTGIIPEAELVLESSLMEYQASQVDFLTVLDNELTLYYYQIRYYRALADHEKSMAQLEQAIGRRLY